VNDTVFVKSLSGSEHRLGQGRRAAHQFGACLLVGADQRGLEKCTDDAERVITSQLAAACPQDRQFEASGEGGAFVEQTRLTHTARPLYDTNLAAAVLGRS